MISRAIVWTGLCMIIPLLVWLVGCEQKQPEHDKTLMLTPATNSVIELKPRTLVDELALKALIRGWELRDNGWSKEEMLRAYDSPTNGTPTKP